MGVNMGLNENFPQHLMNAGPAQINQLGNITNFQGNQMGAMGINQGSG
jgi:hypothetical protein